MQSRFWISTHPSFEEAKIAKDKSIENNPDGTFQIRVGTDKGKKVFRLVERFKIGEAKVVQQNHQKKGKKRREVDLSWVRSR